MIRVGRICEIKACGEDADGWENWMIVRSPDELPAYACHVPQLSPSVELFKMYREAFHAGRYNQKYFDEIYVPRFLSELSENREALSLLEMLCETSQRKNYFLACYCEEEASCHRSIIAGILSGMGAQILTNPSYEKYYRMLLELTENKKDTHADF